MFNFITGIIVNLVHYRSKWAKDSFLKRLKEVQNPNETEKTDIVIDRQSADEFFSKCTPFTPVSFVEKKFLFRSDDPMFCFNEFDTTKYITIHYDIGKYLRMNKKVGFRLDEIEYIKSKVIQMQKWVFAIKEFGVVLSYKTIDEQGFVIVAEVGDNENKFDKAVRIMQIMYERLGMQIGSEYVGFLPELKGSITSHICPFSFDDAYMFGCVDDNGNYFGSFDCMKLDGTAEDILEQKERVKKADFNEVEIKFDYSNEMKHFDEKKYNVIETKGLNVVIKGGMKPESEWVTPIRQLTFSDDGINVVYNNDSIINDNREKQIHNEQIEELGPDANEPVFTIIDKDGNFSPMCISKFNDLCVKYEHSTLVDVPVVGFGGYQSYEQGKFVPSKLVLFQFKDVKDHNSIIEYLKSDNAFQSVKFVCAFRSQIRPDDLCILTLNNGRFKFDTYWKNVVNSFESSLSLVCEKFTGSIECTVPIPEPDSLVFF